MDVWEMWQARSAEWPADVREEVLLRYVANQQDAQAFADYLAQVNEDEAFFGPQPQLREERVSIPDIRTEEGRERLRVRHAQAWSRMRDAEPWRAYRPGWHKMRSGVSAEALQRVDWMLHEFAGLECRTVEKGQVTHWQNGLATLYLEAGGNWQVLEDAIRYAWREYQPGDPHGFVKTARTKRAAASPNRQQVLPLETVPDDWHW